MSLFRRINVEKDFREVDIVLIKNDRMSTFWARPLFLGAFQDLKTRTGPLASAESTGVVSIRQEPVPVLKPPLRTSVGVQCVLFDQQGF